MTPTINRLTQSGWSEIAPAHLELLYEDKVFSPEYYEWFLYSKDRKWCVARPINCNIFLDIWNLESLQCFTNLVFTDEALNPNDQTDEAAIAMAADLLQIEWETSCPINQTADAEDA